MPAITGNISLYMGPSQLNQKDDLEQVIVAFIEEAKTRLDVAVQEIDARPIALALIRARRRGVRVRVMLESDYLHSTPRSSRPPTLDPDPGALRRGGRELNRYLAAALFRSGVQVRLDLNANIFHQKFMVRDRSADGGAVLTGSTNFTTTGTRENLNHIVVIDDKDIAKVYHDEFREIWQGTFGTKRSRHDPIPEAVKVSGVRVKPLFAPEHAPEMEIMKQMLKATKRIDFAIFTFSESSGIDDTLLRLLDNNIAVKGALDSNTGRRTWAPTDRLIAKGANLVVVEKSGALNKLHHKLMVIDEEVVITGSFNYTGPANRLNDENIVVLGDRNEGNAQARDRQRRLAAYAKQEIDRICQAHG